MSLHPWQGTLRLPLKVLHQFPMCHPPPRKKNSGLHPLRSSNKTIKVRAFFRSHQFSKNRLVVFCCTWHNPVSILGYRSQVLHVTGTHFLLHCVYWGTVMDSVGVVQDWLRRHNILGAFSGDLAGCQCCSAYVWLQRGKPVGQPLLLLLAKVLSQISFLLTSHCSFADCWSTCWADQMCNSFFWATQWWSLLSSPNPYSC